MTGQNANREVEALVAKTSRTRLQIQSTWERFENLVAAVESAKEAEQRAKSLVSPRGKRQKRQGDNRKTLNLEDQARLLGKHVKDQIPTDEVESLIRETEENRLRLQKAGQKLEDLRATVYASQDSHAQKQRQRSAPRSKHRAFNVSAHKLSNPLGTAKVRIVKGK